MNARRKASGPVLWTIYFLDRWAAGWHPLIVDQGSRTIIDAIPNTVWYARKEADTAFVTSNKVPSTLCCSWLRIATLWLLMPSAQQGKSFQSFGQRSSYTVSINLNDIAMYSFLQQNWSLDQHAWQRGPGEKE
ncbi:hypothetical protein HDV63DRAFT_214767 [Trichoderma sp. SZMC 28014]